MTTNEEEGNYEVIITLKDASSGQESVITLRLTLLPVNKDSSTIDDVSEEPSSENQDGEAMFGDEIVEPVTVIAGVTSAT